MSNCSRALRSLTLLVKTTIRRSSPGLSIGPWGHRAGRVLARQPSQQRGKIHDIPWPSTGHVPVAPDTPHQRTSVRPVRADAVGAEGLREEASGPPRNLRRTPRAGRWTDRTAPPADLPCPPGAGRCLAWRAVSARRITVTGGPGVLSMQTITREQAIEKLQSRSGNSSTRITLSVTSRVARASIAMACPSGASTSSSGITGGSPIVVPTSPALNSSGWPTSGSSPGSSCSGRSLSCDTQAIEHDTCCGWDGWDAHTLARYVKEVCGEDVQVGPDGTT